MPIPLFNQLNNQRIQQNPVQNPAQNRFGFFDLVKLFNQFRAGFTGNAEQMVREKLQNGQMSQEQFKQLGQMADEFLKLLPR